MASLGEKCNHVLALFFHLAVCALIKMILGIVDSEILTRILS